MIIPVILSGNLFAYLSTVFRVGADRSPPKKRKRWISEQKLLNINYQHDFMKNTFTQSWQRSKKHPTGAPVFFVDGKRVSLKKGIELTLAGNLGSADYLKSWLKDRNLIKGE